MKQDITQDNIHLLLPGKVTALARFYSKDHGCSMLEALRSVYSSALYQQLSDESTKLWTLGNVMLYNML